MKIAKGLKQGLQIAILAVSVMILTLHLLGVRAHAVLSGSMEPALQTGGAVFVKQKERDSRPGDIITYRLGDVLVTHRVIRKEQGCYVTKGDANEAEDAGLVAPSRIVGTVVGYVPLLGYCAVFLRTKKGCLLLLILGIGLFLYEKVSGKKNKRDNAGPRSG